MMADKSKEEFEVTKLNKIRRLAKRGTYDKEEVTKILKEAIWCYVGFNINLKNMNADKSDENSDEKSKDESIVTDLQPCVIPTLFGHK